MSNPTGQSKKDFQALAESDRTPGLSLSIGSAVAWLRDGLARVLVRIGITPNRLTVAGFCFTLAGAGVLVISASHALPVDPMAPAGVRRSWLPFVAGCWLLLAAACDMLDGAVARLGGLQSPVGAVLDSCLDRFSDIAVWFGCALHFAARGNVTYNALAIAAMANALLISYIKARAEDLIEDCTVGYWQRGERFSAILVGCATGHMQAVLWQQAILPFFTVLRRLFYAGGVLRAKSSGAAEPVRGPLPGWRGYVAVWRHPRGSVGYDLVTGLNIALIIFGPWLFPVLYGSYDPLYRLLSGAG